MLLLYTYFVSPNLFQIRIWVTPANSSSLFVTSTHLPLSLGRTNDVPRWPLNLTTRGNVFLSGHFTTTWNWVTNFQIKQVKQVIKKNNQTIYQLFFNEPKKVAAKGIISMQDLEHGLLTKPSLLSMISFPDMFVKETQYSFLPHPWLNCLIYQCQTVREGKV